MSNVILFIWQLKGLCKIFDLGDLERGQRRIQVTGSWNSQVRKRGDNVLISIREVMQGPLEYETQIIEE